MSLKEKEQELSCDGVVEGAGERSRGYAWKNLKEFRTTRVDG